MNYINTRLHDLSGKTVSVVRDGNPCTLFTGIIRPYGKHGEYCAVNGLIRQHYKLNCNDIMRIDGQTITLHK